MRDWIVGDVIIDSPVGPGTLTGASERGYPMVNHITVACCKRDDGAVFDPHGHYDKPAPSQPEIRHA